MKLWTHQQDTVKRYEELKGRAYNASDPGTGKTIATLAYAFKHNFRTLILAPKTLLEAAWLDDWMKFDSHPDVVVAYANNRARAFQSGVPNVITNIEAVNWLAKKENRKYLKNFDLVVCDEATAFKNPSAQRSKNAGIVFCTIPHAINMSGTPMTKTVVDLWHQYKLIDFGARLGPSLSKFRFEFCTPVRPPGAPQGAIRWEDKPGSYERVAELVADITIRHRIEDCLDIPPNHVTWLGYTPSKKAYQQYQELLRHAVLQLETGELLTAANAAVARNKLLQLLTGSLYDAEHNARELDTQRTELIADLLEDREASVVFYLWKHQRIALEKELAKRKIEVAFIDGTVNQKRRAEIVREFQGGKYRAVLLHPETGAHGLTLTRAKTAIFTTPPGDRPDWMIQGIARIVRGGQDKPTETILVYAKDTLEQRVYQNILDERDVGMDFVQYLMTLSSKPKH